LANVAHRGATRFVMRRGKDLRAVEILAAGTFAAVGATRFHGSARSRPQSAL
jgi:hypothetical protein